MTPLQDLEVWFVTGSQGLYGEDALTTVGANAREIAEHLGLDPRIPVRVVPCAVVTSPESIRAVCLEANAADRCIGVIAWMHTFSPARMWIVGLQTLQKPLLHLHTQANRDLPWAEIDMDFMNLHQAAHGDREFGFIETRMGRSRKTVVGHWQDPVVAEGIGWWARAAAAWREARSLRIARFGDNMRNVAVTEGDKVEAQIRLGVTVSGFGVSDLTTAVHDVEDTAAERLMDEYQATYRLAPELCPEGEARPALREAARIELGLRAFLGDGGFGAFTDTFEDLGTLTQLPGIAVQRLMAEGYGFGAEGDWKTAVMVRLLKVMGDGLPGGSSFMEDYTYHLAPDGPKVLGAHMLEVCPTIASGEVSCEIHPLSIGGKADPVRLVFTAGSGPAVVTALMDLGDRFRLLANEIDLVQPDEPLPRLPVARAVWQPRPDLRTAAEAWLVAGGSHHTALSRAIPVEPLADLAEMSGLEFLLIDGDTQIGAFRKEMRWNQAYYRLARGL